MRINLILLGLTSAHNVHTDNYDPKAIDSLQSMFKTTAEHKEEIHLNASQPIPGKKKIENFSLAHFSLDQWQLLQRRAGHLRVGRLKVQALFRSNWALTANQLQKWSSKVQLAVH